MSRKSVSGKSSRLDELSINTIRFLSVDAVEKAKSGHPGMPMGAASMAYVLWTRFLKHNPSNPFWFDRDRFILSAGHGSMLLYSLLHLTGYAVSLDDIKQFRQWGSITPGHPERGIVPGVEVTTGPLGQGFANGVGMAIAEAYLAARYNRPGFKIINHYTYAIVSDGDVMEGVASEAASLAGHLGLGKLIYLYDNNHISLAASTDVTFTEDRAKRLESYGWHVQTIKNGNDLNAVDNAIRAAEKEKNKPSIILVRTHIGYGSPNKQDTFEAHGSPLGDEEVKLTKENLGWPIDPSFYIPEGVLAHFRKAVELGEKKEAEWKSIFMEYSKAFPEPAKELSVLMRGELPEGWDSDMPLFPADAKGMATRVASGKIINKIAPGLPHLIGGSCDLDPSTHTAMNGMGDFENPVEPPGDPQGSIGKIWGFAGRNVHFGVREHAMGSVLNGIAAHGGIIPFGSTFLIFSDYMRPPIRLAALMGLKVVYVFTHDSISVGEDGPTHQPVEQLAGLRAIPELTVIRPCDANETAEAWRVAIKTKDRPVALVLTRQNVPTFEQSGLDHAGGLKNGAYILSEAENGRPDIILIASGSEVSLAMDAKQKLGSEHGIKVRVVSMPSWELFEEQSPVYKGSVLPRDIPARLTIEAGSTYGWLRYAGEKGGSIGIDKFGASAPGGVVMKEYGFTVDNVCSTALEIISRAREK
ncbi:MAG: transketolase [Deltaproteobacteria bacterium]|nr:transketolase [Deltaproteobacteria bacterium]MCL5878369.1 transketolase [Deltaproteobacteria bacterium]